MDCTAAARRALLMLWGTLLLTATLPPGLAAYPVSDPPDNPNASCPAGTQLLAKFEVKNGRYVLEKPSDDRFAVTISGDARSASWTSTSPVYAVVLKGARDTDTILYVGGAGTGAFTNENLSLPRGSGHPDISNVQFCGSGDAGGGDGGGDGSGGGDEDDTPCVVVTEGCITVGLLEVVENGDGTRTYRYRVTSDCDRGLSFIAFELPEGAGAVSYTTDSPVRRAENPGGTTGPYNPRYRNIKFELSGDIKDGESLVLEYTLPADAAYEDVIRIRAKYGRQTTDLVLDPRLCGSPCPTDGVPPEIGYDVVYDEAAGKYNVVITVSDENGITSVDIDAFVSNGDYDNARLVSSDFTPGVRQATFVYRIISLDLNTIFLTEATDGCGNTSCPDDTEKPALDLEVASENGTTVVYGTASDPSGIEDFAFFALQNAEVTEQSFTPGAETATFKIVKQNPAMGAGFGLLVADPCNAFVFDPAPEEAAGSYSRRAPETADPRSNLPAAFALHANYPNPFSASTTLRFDLPETAHVRLAVFDLLGREVAVLVDEHLPAGTHQVDFDAGRLPNGIYLYRLVTPQRSFVKQMALVR